MPPAGMEQLVSLGVFRTPPGGTASNALSTFSSATGLSRRDESKCYVRAMLRESARHYLVQGGHQKMAEEMFLTSSSRDDLQLINSSEMTRHFWGIVKVVMVDKRDVVEQSLDYVDSWDCSEKDLIRRLRTVVQRLSINLNFGRVIALIGLLGCTAARLQPRGTLFARAVVSELEAEIDGQVHDWLERSEGLEELKQKIRQQDKKPGNPSKTLRNVSIIAVGALAFAFAFSKS